MHEYTGPHDYFNEAYVNEWASVANSKRPFRPEFFEAFVFELAVLHNPKVLDVGSGPGFLAERILGGCNVDTYHLLSLNEHETALMNAGFEEIRPVHSAGDLVLFAATRCGEGALR